MDSFPFFVGSGRSGTTLIRAMFDAHPRMAIPDESKFLPAFVRRRRRYERASGLCSALFLEDLCKERWWRQLGLSRRTVLEAFDRDRPRDLADAVRLVYRLYAVSRGKDRYGDKSPSYIQHLPSLAELFPEACFVHIVRDGRDVVLSFLDADFGPGSVVEAALQWRDRVAQGTKTGRALGSDRYVEVRYEDLVQQPERTLVSLCAFVGLSFHPEMLSYFGREGGAASSDLYKYRHVRLPPTAGLRDWRSQMSPRDVAVFEEVAGGLLEQLGYERAGRQISVGTGVVVQTRLVDARLRRMKKRLPGLRRAGTEDGATPAPPILRGPPRDDYAEVLSLLLATEAGKEQTVASFRREVMRGRLLALDEVDGWVQQRAEANERSAAAGTLEYATRECWPLRQPTIAGGVLDRLRLLSVGLEERYGWEPHQAATFVLTDLPPLIAPLRARVVGGWPRSATTRIVLEVSPAVDPSRVMQHYEQVRRKLIPRGFPELDAKRLRLAAFVASHPDEDWSTLFDMWNGENPSWRYADPSGFKRDAQLTRGRLLEPPW